MFLRGSSQVRRQLLHLELGVRRPAFRLFAAAILLGERRPGLASPGSRRRPAHLPGGVRRAGHEPLRRGVHPDRSQRRPLPCHVPAPAPPAHDPSGEVGLRSDMARCVSLLHAVPPLRDDDAVGGGPGAGVDGGEVPATVAGVPARGGRVGVHDADGRPAHSDVRHTRRVRRHLAQSSSRHGARQSAHHRHLLAPAEPEDDAYGARHRRQLRALPNAVPRDAGGLARQDADRRDSARLAARLAQRTRPLRLSQHGRASSDIRRSLL